MQEWCYDNPDLDDFDQIDHRIYEFYLIATEAPIIVGHNITLLQVQNTTVKPVPFLMAGSDLTRKGIVIEHVEKKLSGLCYEVVIRIKEKTALPASLQLVAFWEDEEDWSEIVNSTQNFRQIDSNNICFRFNNLSPEFNGYFVLMDPGYKMTDCVPDFEPDYACKSMDTETLKKKAIEVYKKINAENSNQSASTGIIYTTTRQDISNNTDNEDVSLKFTLVKYGICALIVVLSVFEWVAPGLIRSCKEQRLMDEITLGGSRSEANESIERYNASVTQINKITDNAINQYNEILLYTNDTTVSEAVIEPNLNYNVFESVCLGRSLILRNNEISEELHFFAKHADSLGFNVLLKTDTSNVKIAQLKLTRETKQFIAITFYYYSEKEKQILKELIEKDNSRYSVLKKSKEQRIKELDELQYSRVILTDSELIHQKIEDNLRALFAPIKGSINSSHRFYFGAYNTQIDSDEFMDKVSLFSKMFLSKKPIPGCAIRKIKLKRT